MSSNSLTTRIGFLPALALVLLLTLSAAAQELEIAVSPNPVGSGARAAGMGDAFLAVADDATAASWNPAGLIQLERPELSVVGSFNQILESLDADAHPEFSSDQSAAQADLNFLSLVYPLPRPVLGHNLCLSLSYQRRYDFSRNLRLKYNDFTSAAGYPISSLLDMEFKQTGGLSTLTPAFAVEITPRLSLGMALNLWRSTFLADNGWEQRTRTSIGIAGGILKNTAILDDERYEDFTGENLTLGMLWRATENWSFGLRYNTQFTGKADFHASRRITEANLPSSLNLLGRSAIQSSLTNEEREITFPPSLAIGTAFRPNDRIVLSFDITRTDWNNYYYEDTEGRRFSLVNAAQLNGTSEAPHFDPTYTFRLGAEYALIPKHPDETMKYLVTLRGGLFYDEEPASGHGGNVTSMSGRGNGNPDGFYGTTIGIGCLAFQRVNIDVAYQARFAADVNNDLVRGVAGFREDALQHRVLLATIVYF